MSQYRNGRSFLHFCYNFLPCPRFQLIIPSFFLDPQVLKKKFHLRRSWRYPSGSNNEAIVVRTCLFVVAVMLLLNFFVFTINWFVIVSHCNPKTLVMVSSIRSFMRSIFLFSSGELEFQSRKFIDISRNNFFAFEYSCSASSMLSAPAIRLSPLPSCLLQWSGYLLFHVVCSRDQVFSSSMLFASVIRLSM